MAPMECNIGAALEPFSHFNWTESKAFGYLLAAKSGNCVPMAGKPGGPVLLHGELDMQIIEAKSLPNMDMTGGAKIARTRVIHNDENPSWNEHVHIPVVHTVDKVEFFVKDDDRVGAELIGKVEIPADKFFSGKEISSWFPILGHSGDPLKTGAQLHLSIQYKPVGEDPLYRNGVGADDAHVPDATLPEILLDDGNVFCHRKCWEDTCHTMLEAKYRIYVVGWSVYHPTRLVREPTSPLPSAGERTLGDLLKYKSQGVRVILLIWDDKTSNDDVFLKTIVGNLFAHHQKCVLVDTKAPGNEREITAFIGGLDLCDGRYDTPKHRLFSDLDTVFGNDVHNPTFTTISGGPREPWHDLHCKIDGPAAYDVLTNFEQRYNKAMKWLKLRKVKQGSDTLLKLDRIAAILMPSVGPDGDLVVRVTSEQDPESWNVQVFRSIDSGSVKGFPKDIKEAEAQNLVSGKNLKIERSIHLAYVKAIRSAQHFVYVENQYFLGSSYNSGHRTAMQLRSKREGECDSFAKRILFLSFRLEDSSNILE
ncbi:putative ankyrin repeat domain-containing protein 2-like [Capsicum annuum]|uniref:phospholipase D n=1 Tax=Capsicum annuum TaxID=4072 RepID=A0A2G2YL76_CAPAN|nr:putative ankyrin repeat domain-containing protein 2-like [Capsicum annuum]KAF3670364.1 putative ankyrin repeat domain-containing protein 2-like [Capsicum annuum]PHT70351.1 hypothetical protein T459_25455 [Capsicum annuum]